MGQRDKEVENRRRRNMKEGEYKVSKYIIGDYASLFLMFTY
jgi:hypothetical protein